MTSSDSTNQLLQKFWEMETLPEKRTLSLEEETCEILFSETTTRTSESRYIVRLPRKLNAFLLDSPKLKHLKDFIPWKLVLLGIQSFACSIQILLRSMNRPPI